MIKLSDYVIQRLEETGVKHMFMLPGGGAEPGETREACCVRETEEETGRLVRPVRSVVTLNEFYEDYKYVTYYFECEDVGKGSAHLTEAEKKWSLRPEWVPLERAMEIFGTHQEWAETDEMRRGIYLRELTALQEYLKRKG